MASLHLTSAVCSTNESSENMKRCKITVVKKFYHADLVQQFSCFEPEHGACPLFSEGQTFLCDLNMPEHFCSWAWDDIHKMVFAALGDADFNCIVANSSKSNHACLACCTDGYRPVVFLIETVDAPKRID